MIDTAPTTVTPGFTVSNKIPVSTSAATFRKQVLAGKRLIGVNLTDGAVAPSDPTAAAKLLASYGVNWVRLHHIDVGLVKGWWTVEQILAFISELRANGIRCSVDGFSKLGELYSGDFKQDLMNGVDSAVALYKQNIERITPILKQCFLVSLENECGHKTSWQKGGAFIDQWSPVFRGINPNILIGGFADAWQGQPVEWVHTIQKLDVFLVHMYGGGEDFGSHGGGNWINESWVLGDLHWREDWLRRNGYKGPVMIQETGSFSVNKNYVENEMYLQTLAAGKGWSTCIFAFATNEDGWKGTGTDKYAATTDLNRLTSLLYGSYLNKNLTGLSLKMEGEKLKPDFKGATGDKVLMPDRSIVKVGSYIFRTDNCPAWARITRVL